MPEVRNDRHPTHRRHTIHFIYLSRQSTRSEKRRGTNNLWRKGVMDELLSDQLTLEADAEFTDPLERVAYASGMMLGLDAIRDEQHYHRRRLSRHH